MERLTIGAPCSKEQEMREDELDDNRDGFNARMASSDSVLRTVCGSFLGIGMEGLGLQGVGVAELLGEELEEELGVPSVDAE